jgi:FtsP/CotA-like multicopper oxidase with cupredoxin domain
MRTTALLLAATLLAGSPAIAAEYDLVVARTTVTVDGRTAPQITINGGTPGPTLRLKEGEAAVIRVTNNLPEETSIHWHGLILPGEQDGVPGMNGFPGIKPGETFTYRFPVVQNGTYWYHAHSATQEQAGHYGGIVIEAARASAAALKADREHVVLLSEFTGEDPERILRNLKVEPGYYNYSKRTLPDFIRDARKFGLGKAMKDRADWRRMNMDPTDIADTGNYTFLVNGKGPKANETFLFGTGEKVKLRFVNATAMTFFDVRIPGLKMTVVASDGRAVQPVTVDEFRIAVAEAYDVIVEPEAGKAYTLFAESIDRSGYALATLAPRAGMTAPVPARRPRALLTMAEMGHNTMPGMDHAAMGHGAGTPMNHSQHQAAASAPVDHAAMGHGAAQPTAATGHAGMDHSQHSAAAANPVSHAAMGHGSAQPTATADHAGMDHSQHHAASTSQDHAATGHGTSPAATPSDHSQHQAGPSTTVDHAAMGHGAVEPSTEMDHSAHAAHAGPVDHAAMGHGAEQKSSSALPKIDYGMGREVQMTGMDHAAMGHGEGLGEEGEFDGSGRVFGWASGAPHGSRVLSYADLRSLEPQKDTRAPTREIVVRLTGNMERYIWTMNGKKFGEAEPFKMAYGERVRVTFINETMMAHPMHLHGMFMQADNGADPSRMPDKTVLAVAPGRTASAIITADQKGEWAFHCHLLFHMESGMMQKLVVATSDGPESATTPAPAAPSADPHAGHGSHS